MAHLGMCRHRWAVFPGLHSRTGISASCMEIASGGLSSFGGKGSNGAIVSVICPFVLRFIPSPSSVTSALSHRDSGLAGVSRAPVSASFHPSSPVEATEGTW